MRRHVSVPPMGECEKLPSTAERYTERFARVLAHIEANSETATSLDELSDLAAFSRHHFHRQFSGFSRHERVSLRAVHAHAARVVAAGVPARSCR